MPSFLSKVFGRKKDDKGLPQWDSGELLGGKFEAISPNVSPTAAKYLDLEPSGSDIDNEKEHGPAFFRSKSRPSSPEVKPARLFDTLPPLSLNFDDLNFRHTSNGHIFEELNADATEAVIGQRRLNPFEALVLIRACSQAITSRGLETLGIMTPHWYSASPDVQRSLISRCLTSLNTMSPTTATSSFSPQISNFDYEVELTRSIHDVAAVFRWGIRHLQLDGDAFGTDDGWYKAFLDAEAADDYPPKAFSEKLAPKLPLSHLDLLLTTLELFSSLASFSESNSTSGSKLSKIFGLWLLTSRRVEDKDDWRTFYARWERTGRMLEHLFLARIRDQSTDHRMPVRLLELVRKYPYTHGLSSPTTDLQLLPRPQQTTIFHDALLVRVDYEVSSQNQVPTSKFNPSVLLADALSTKVEGEYAELWAKITAAASKIGTEAPLAKVFADETLRLLSLVPGKPKEETRSPTFSLLSLVETHRASSPTGVSALAKPHLDYGPRTTPLSPINIGGDWEHFSNSGFLDVSPNILPLASTLFDTDIEKTVPPEPPAISRKSSRRVSVPKKIEVPSLQEPVEVEPLPSQPQQVITTSGFDIVQIDEAFVDFWSDALLDPIASDWPAFVLCKFKPTLVPELKFGSEGDLKTVTWLILEQMFTVKPPPPPPPPPPQPVPPPADDEEVEQSTSPVPQTPSGRRRFNFWSISRTASASSTGSQKTKKVPRGQRVNELGEVIEDGVKRDTVKIKLPGMKRKSSEGKNVKEKKSMDLKPSSTPLPAVLESVADAPAVTSSIVAATSAIATDVVENVPEPEISAVKGAPVTSEVSELHVDATVPDPTIVPNIPVEGTPAETNVPIDVSQTSVVDSRVLKLDDATKVGATDIPNPGAEAELTSLATGVLLGEGSAAVETANEEAEPEALKIDQEEPIASIPMVEDAEHGQTEVTADGIAKDIVEVTQRDHDQNPVDQDPLVTITTAVPGPEDAQSEAMTVSHVEDVDVADGRYLTGSVMQVQDLTSVEFAGVTQVPINVLESPEPPSGEVTVGETDTLEAKSALPEAPKEAQTMPEDEPGPLSYETPQPADSVAVTEELPEAPWAEETHDASEGAPAFEASLVAETIVVEESESPTPKLSVEDTVAEELGVPSEEKAVDASDHPATETTDEEVRVNDIIDESSVVEMHVVAEAVAAQLSEEDLARQPELVVEQERAVEVSTTVAAAEADETVVFIEEHPNAALEGTLSQDAPPIGGEETLAPETALDAEGVVISAKEISGSAAQVDTVKQETPITETALDLDAEPEVLAGPIEVTSLEPEVEVPPSITPEAAPLSEDETAPSVGDVPPVTTDATTIQETPPITITTEAASISDPEVAAAPAETVPLEATKGTTDVAKEADEASDAPEAPVEETHEVATETEMTSAALPDTALDIPEAEEAAPSVDEPLPVATEETPAGAAQIPEEAEVEKVAVEETPLATPEAAVPTQVNIPEGDSKASTVEERPTREASIQEIPVVETQDDAIADAPDPSLEESPTDIPAHIQETVEAAHGDIPNISEEVQKTESVVVSVEDTSQSVTEGPASLEDVDASGIPERDPLAVGNETQESKDTTEEPSATIEDPVTQTAIVEPVDVKSPINLHEAPATLEENPTVAEEHLSVEGVSAPPAQADITSEEPTPAEATSHLEDLPGTSEPFVSSEESQTPVEPPVADEDIVITVIEESTSALDQSTDVSLSVAEEEPASAAEKAPEVAIVGDANVEAPLLTNEDIVVGEPQEVPTAAQTALSQEHQSSVEESVILADPDVTTGSDSPALDGHASAVSEAAPELTAVLDEVPAEPDGSTITSAEAPLTPQDETNIPAVAEELSPVVEEPGTIDEVVLRPQEESTPVLEEVAEVVEEAVPDETGPASVEFPKATVEEQSHGGDAIASSPHGTDEATLDVPPAAVLIDEVSEHESPSTEIEETEMTSTVPPFEAPAADDSVAPIVEPKIPLADSDVVPTNTIANEEVVLAGSKDTSDQHTELATDETETTVAELPGIEQEKLDMNANGLS